MNKIAIFGANGNFGFQAAKAFTKAGWQVRAITRDGIYDRVEVTETASADAMDETQVIAATKGCEYILNCVNPPYPKWGEMCMPVALNMISAAKQHGAVHLFPANVYNYGTEIPSVIHNSSPMKPDTKKGQIRLDMEQLFEKFAIENGVQTIIIRAGDFFGGQNPDTSWFDLAICKSLAKGKMTYPGPMDIIHSWAYLPDFAQSFVKMAEQSEKLDKFETFLFEGHAISGNQLLSALENVVGKPLKPARIPWSLIRLAGIFSPMMKEVSEMSYLWNAPHQMDASKLESRIDNLQHTPLEQALSKALANSDNEFQIDKEIPQILAST